MRTRINAGWVVGFDGTGHDLLRNGVVVYEDDTILHVGHRFDGQVDRTIEAPGMLVSPGLINCHTHARLNAHHALFRDQSKADYFGQNFIAYAATLDGRPSDYQASIEVDTKFAVWSAVRGGATTILDVGTWAAFDGVPEMLGELGVRAYLGPGYRSADYAFDADGRITWRWNEQAGEAGLRGAIEFIRRYDGASGGLIRGFLYPGQLDTCTPDLLRATKRAASELGVGIQIHAAMNLVEFHAILRDQRKTPIEFMAAIGFLGPEVTLGHGVFHAGHSWCHYPYVDDLGILADSGASVVHAPHKYLKMGIALESFDRYRRRGVNLALGTDTYPEDMVQEMRLASIATRLVDGSFRTGDPHEVFEAATLGGARALGRHDLGRLAPGAKADIILVDLRQIHFGGVRDPIVSLVDSASGRDVDTVIINGQTLVEGGVAIRLDEQALLAQAQEACERYWSSVPALRGASLEEISPMSFPIRAEDA